MTAANADAFSFLRSLTEASFFGTITLKFEHGAVVHIRKEENLKPSELSGTRGPQHANANNQ
jgi:hypothetical protein